ncbi:hypothetical protein HDU86_005882 [Geranomyces michiganensis]|nr:hypothetical protein HDU86_005882 [Geranomyces michiganensis]
MSVVFYKFKSAKDYDTCTFDGTNISVFDLKREILVAKKLGKGTDFDLAVFHAQTNEEYKDDMYQIPRNTSVLVSRQPASKPGKGTAQKYLTTSMPTGAMMGGSRGRGAPMPAVGPPKHHSLNNRAPQKPTAPGEPPKTEVEGETEEDRIANMFKMQTEQWAETQDRMAFQKPIHRQYPGGGRGGGYRGGHQAAGGDRPPPTGGADGNPNISRGWGHGQDYEQRPPPPGYICYRCGQKGHFINNCPTIGEKEFDRPKLKRTTGIPKIFLKVVDDKHAAEGGVMVTQNGELVVAQPNDQAWADVAARNRNYLGAGDVYEMAPVPEELACAICKKLLRDAVQTPCCGTKYCDECIRTHLLENEDPDKRLKCPNCGADQSPDNLVANKALRQAVDQHIRDFISSKSKSNHAPPTTTRVMPQRPAASPAISRPAAATTSVAAAAAAGPAPAAPIPLPNIPVINRRPAGAKPFKIIGKSDDAGAAGATAKAANVIKRIATEKPAAQADTATIAATTAPRRSSIQRFPAADYPAAAPVPVFNPAFASTAPYSRAAAAGFAAPHMMMPSHMMPDFDPRWGGMIPPPHHHPHHLHGAPPHPAMMAGGPGMRAPPYWDGPMHAAHPLAMRGYGGPPPPPAHGARGYGPPREYYGGGGDGGRERAYHEQPSHAGAGGAGTTKRARDEHDDSDAAFAKTPRRE